MWGLQNWLGMAAPCNILVQFNKVEGRKMATQKDKGGQSYKAPVFLDGEDIKGKIIIDMSKGKRIDHQGIKVELIGTIENLIDKAQTTNFI